MRHLEIPVSEQFQPYVEAALTRVGYLIPEAQIEYNKNNAMITVYISGDVDEIHISKEVKYALYREKIYKETLPIRNKILGAQQ